MKQDISKYNRTWRSEQPDAKPIRDNTRADDVGDFITRVARCITALAIVAVIIAGVMTLVSRNSQRPASAPAHHSVLS